ncbi:RrF2 family transcriptional regulator [Anaeromicropila herbilytica]|uniref:AsnC family transcriptional regulator n=1 Tax=Anaeromicropila herbilytica TaxID=2785025 RepID=A0A7R7EJ85_9FIRM|nr:Rrf2 family transcriptional regulator [Anaeromicropila herbilytica]BCN29802.1 AsnC family transcriptional regulator [Anaeromicropila herbilytica]
MKVSTKGIYAIEAMVDLAIHSKDSVESIKNIAERRNLSEKYLEQIIGALRKAGLILSTRGAGGGYQLARGTDQITVLQILEAVENNLKPIECLYKETDCGIVCTKCATREFWSDLWDNIEVVATEVTLELLVKESEKVNETTEVEYYI